MRPKFRVWHKDGKVILSNYLGFMVTDAGQLLIESMLGDEATMEKVELENYIVMQYTDKKDKNGVEVYFNDIVEDEYGHRYEVVFEGDCLRCNGLRRIRGGHKPKNRWFGIDLKIIGNRYENPELLKEQNK